MELRGSQRKDDEKNGRKKMSNLLSLSQELIWNQFDSLNNIRKILFSLPLDVGVANTDVSGMFIEQLYSQIKKISSFYLKMKINDIENDEPIFFGNGNFSSIRSLIMVNYLLECFSYCSGLQQGTAIDSPEYDEGQKRIKELLCKICYALGIEPNSLSSI
jgi:hypothetical protein